MLSIPATKNTGSTVIYLTHLLGTESSYFLKGLHQIAFVWGWGPQYWGLSFSIL